MTTTLLPPPPASPGSESPPLLMPGDRLDRKTFHARYEAMPEGVKWELVGGVVYMSALYRPHALMQTEVIVWLGLYKAATPGVEVPDNATVLLADDGEPQPDASLIISPGRGGQVRDEDVEGESGT